MTNQLKSNTFYSWEWHFFHGLQLGYPLCCVLWFCSSWTNMGEQRNSLYAHLSEGNPYSIETNWNKEGDYIKCPNCLLSNSLGKV